MRRELKQKIKALTVKKTVREVQARIMLQGLSSVLAYRIVRGIYHHKLKPTTEAKILRVLRNG